MKDIDELVSFSNELLNLSRNIIRSHRSLEIDHEIKADGSPVTTVDREVEQKLRELIDARYPQHGVIGEEFPDRDIDAERVWLLDPIDGTKQYATGIPLFGTLLALAERGCFVLGAMDFPATDDRWIGGQGYPTLWNGNRAGTRQCRDLAHALVAPGDPARGMDPDLTWTQVTAASRFCLWGTGSYGFAMVASGRLDVAIDNDLDPFDFAAPAAVIEAAGGSVTDWRGEPLTLASEGSVLFLGDAHLLESVIALLQG